MKSGIIHLVRRQIFPKNRISYSLIRIRMCVFHGVRNLSFAENSREIGNSNHRSDRKHKKTQVSFPEE